ncbi:hypothetical protein L1987_87137 [Smallanthus sonchifolius]|nr:hypothetical protein L1987_87137 [Smallanthus sonchifolius]
MIDATSKPQQSLSVFKETQSLNSSKQQLNRKSVQSMKVVCHELAAATNDPEGSLMDDLIKDTDRLVSCAKSGQELHGFFRFSG